MVLSALVVLVLAALVLVVAHAVGKAPLWVAVLLVIVVQMLQVLGR